MTQSIDLTQIVNIWLSGGWVMAPLFVLAVILYAQSFHLLLYVRSVKLDGASQRHWLDWVRTPGQAEGRVRDVVLYTQTNANSSDHVRNRFGEVRRSVIEKIDRRTRFVAMLVAASPLLGLLGTVIGMLQTFMGLSTSAGTESAGVVAAGISEALITTQAGLIIALPGLFVVLFIQRQRQQMVTGLARLECLTLSHFNFDSTAAAAEVSA